MKFEWEIDAALTVAGSIWLLRWFGLLDCPLWILIIPLMAVPTYGYIARSCEWIRYYVQNIVRFITSV